MLELLDEPLTYTRLPVLRLDQLADIVNVDLLAGRVSADVGPVGRGADVLAPPELVAGEGAAPALPTPTRIAAPAAKVNGNGSPAIQKGYRKGVPPASKGRRYPAEVLTPTEIRALLDATPRTGPTGVRNRALIVLLWRSGLRISEALDLYPKDIDMDRATVTVLCGKGGKRRTVGIDRKALEYVAAWLDYRQSRLGFDRYLPVFCTFQSGRPPRRLSPEYVRTNLKLLARKAGIDRRVHPHGLRHTLAASLADEGMDLRVVQRQLGHSNVATTARYVDHLTPGKALEAVQRREWPEGIS
jgi:site-specific recombinase XerD